MEVLARATNVRRHTTGWKISNKWYTRKQAVNLAKKGKVDGVIVRSGSNDGHYISSHPMYYYSLYELPEHVVKNGKLPRKHHRAY